MPVSAPPPSSQQSTLDKTSVIRLSVANLKIRDVLARGLSKPMTKDETSQAPAEEVDTLACVEGFSVVLGSNLDIIYVSENVTNYIGLSQVTTVDSGMGGIEFKYPNLYCCTMQFCTMDRSHGIIH